MTLSRFNKRSLLCFCILLVAIFSATCGFSQSRIEGEVKGDNGQPVPFANILLMNASDSTLAKGVVTNADGKFIMEDVKSGNFFIVSTMVGYKKTTLPEFEISYQKNLNLRPLVLMEETVQLNEVTIEAEKAMFEQEVDRLVINVQNSITSAGNTVLEVLQKSPGIVVNRQDNSILMYGKSGVRIMMNGKMMGSLNAGIQKKFGNKGVLRLAIDDILYTNYWRVNTNLSQVNLNSRIKYDWHNQFIRFTYSRNFGNKKLRSVQVQSGSEEERRRAN